MSEERSNGKNAAVKLPQARNTASEKALWLVRVEYRLARVERWFESADQIDYLIRRSLLRRVNRGVTARGPFAPPLAPSLVGAVPTPRAEQLGELVS